MINEVMLALSGMPLSKLKATELISVTERALALTANVSATSLVL